MGAGVVVRDVRASSERRPRGSVCRCRAGAAVRADIRRHGSHSSSLLNTPQVPLRRRLTGPHQVPSVGAKIEPLPSRGCRDSTAYPASSPLPQWTAPPPRLTSGQSNMC